VVLVLALALTLIGVYSVDQSMFDVATCLVFGFIGYFMLRYGYAVAAAALGVILGTNIESTLRQGLLIADGSVTTFLARPVTAAVLALALLLLAYGIRSEWRTRRRQPASGDEGLLDVAAAEEVDEPTPEPDVDDQAAARDGTTRPGG
jgi:putative tricarboxylic transport membrane protein